MHAPPVANAPVQAWASVLEPTLILIRLETTAVLVAESDVKPSLNMMLPIIGVAEAEVTPKAPAATTAIAHRRERLLNPRLHFLEQIIRKFHAADVEGKTELTVFQEISLESLPE